MSAMHHDVSPDLKMVAKKLKDIFEVLLLLTSLFSLAFLVLNFSGFEYLQKPEKCRNISEV